jgi:hypothetical protein
MKVDLVEIVKKISEASALELELVWLPKIIDNQTDDEKSKLCTTAKNGTGLNMTDAPYVTSVYNKVKSGGHLSDKQVDVLRKILPKYKRQYARMVNKDIE